MIVKGTLSFLWYGTHLHGMTVTGANFSSDGFFFGGDSMVFLSFESTDQFLCTERHFTSLGFAPGAVTRSCMGLQGSFSSSAVLFCQIRCLVVS